MSREDKKLLDARIFSKTLGKGSHVTCHVSNKVVELIGGGSVINGATPSSF